MENRYEGILREYNDILVKLNPANETLRFVTAFELRNIAHKKVGALHVLDLGCGEGYGTLPLLEHTPESVFVDAVDVSEEMTMKALKYLADYTHRRANIYTYDADTFLFVASPYHAIISSWMIHNFTQDDKMVLFRAIYNKLKPGGHFILMDKLYPQTGAEELLRLQQRRYEYLPRDVCVAIQEHEALDFTDNYRMDETRVVATLGEIGFMRVRVVDRVERDAVLVAEKPVE